MLCDFVVATNIASLGLTGWQCASGFPTTKICGWSGVSCAGGWVTSLAISASKIRGTLPSSIGMLTAITYIALNNNRLYGSIPSSMGSLAKLTYLEFGTNSMTGTIPPELGGMSSMVSMYLDTNSFYGSIPASLCQLKKMTTFMLYWNGANYNGNAGLTCYATCLFTVANFYITLPNGGTLSACTPSPSPTIIPTRIITSSIIYFIYLIRSTVL